MENRMHRLEETVSVLIRAYLRGELKHGYPCDCALGVMIAAREREQHRPICVWMAIMELKNDKSKISQPTELGYLVGELLDIEAVFEGRDTQWERTLFNDNDPDSFIGLTNVFDLLCNELDKDYFEVGDIFEMIGMQNEN